MITEWSLKRDKYECMRILGEAGVPASAVFDTMELYNRPRAAQRSRRSSPCPTPPEAPSPCPAARCACRTRRIPRPQPRCSADNDAVYGELLGYGDDEIKDLASQGAI